MNAPSASPSWLSPQRWFLGPDKLLRPFWRALLFLAAGFVIVVLVQTGLKLVLPGRATGWVLDATYVAMNSGLLLLSWAFLTLLDRRGYRALGLWPYPRWAWEFTGGFGFGAALMLLTALAMVILQALTFHAISAGSAAAMSFLGNAFFLLLAAAFEEIAFRGYAFQRLVDSWGKLGAILALSALFGAAHITNHSSTPLSTANTILAGALLAVAYLKTRGLWLPIGLHWSWNLLMGPVLALPVSGNRIGPGLCVVEVSGPEWLSGGAYGPEGSVVLTVVCTAALVWLALTEKLNVAPAMADEWKLSTSDAEKG
jgi:membrane protease YdiL (CAAX protease family)